MCRLRRYPWFDLVSELLGGGLKSPYRIFLKLFFFFEGWFTPPKGNCDGICPAQQGLADEDGDAPSVPHCNH